MTHLRLASTGLLSPPIPRSPRLAWLQALRDLEKAQDAVYAAHLAVIDSEPGHMLAAVDAWRLAEEREAAAARYERRCRMVAGGRVWLRVAVASD